MLENINVSHNKIHTKRVLQQHREKYNLKIHIYNHFKNLTMRKITQKHRHTDTPILSQEAE